MDNSKSKSKKRKGGDLNAKNFKKALVSPVPTAASSQSGVPETNYGAGGLTDLDLLGSLPSGDEGDSSDDEVMTKTATATTTTKHTTQAASVSKSGLTTMADLLASAGDSNGRHRNIVGTVNEDVIKMQQQLEQQIPLHSTTSASTTTTTTTARTPITREQIMESMTSIPNMRMILEQNLANSTNNGSCNSNSDDNNNNNSSNNTQSSSAGGNTNGITNSSTSTSNSTIHPDASTVLMSLSNDPSILVTITPGQSHSEPATATNTTTTAKTARKRKAKATATPSSSSSAAGSSSTAGIGASSSSSNKDKAPADSERTLEEQLEADLGSDNPLHNKWLMATALKEKGISYRTGTFSSHEDELIRQTIAEYVKRHNMAPDAINRWFENGNGRGRFEKNDLKALWVEIAVRLQTRPLLNIYLHVRRMFHPQNNVGTWSKADDRKLIELYAIHKGQWTTIGNELGRMADSCRDRYRNHLKDMSTMVTGPWQPHEDEKLLGIMQDLALAQGKASILDSNPMWTLISERMEGTRTRHQCRHRYSQTLQPRLERGEWTGPSSAAAAAAAAVAANASSAAEAAKQQQHTIQLHNDLGLGGIVQNNQTKTTTDQDVLILAAALHGATMPTGQNNSNSNNSDSMMWTQAMTTNMNQDADGHHSTSGDLTLGSGGNNFSDSFSATIAAAGLPIPTMVPRAPKGPIRRRGGLQQQLDVLNMILESSVTDHTEIQWTEIAQKLRNKVQESNAIQLAKIIQTQDQLHSKKNHLEDGDSTAVAAAAAVAAMAAAVSAAQAEAVASLQRVPASNQIARTFMSSRCKTEGYRQMTLKQVVALMIQDVERRIQQRRGGSHVSGGSNEFSSKTGSGNEDESRSSLSTSSSSSSHRPLMTSTVMIQQQEINDAAQQAALAALTAAFPELLQQEQDQLAAAAAAAAGSSISSGGNGHGDASSSLSVLHDPKKVPTLGMNSNADMAMAAAAATAAAVIATHQTPEQRDQYRQDLVQQQHDRALAEEMFNSVFINSGLAGTRPMLNVASVTARRQSRATRKVLSVLKSAEFVSDTSDEDDDDE